MSDEKLEKKLDRIVEDITKINITLVSQHHTLKEHMRRSEANEKAIEIIKDELIPIQRHVNGLNFLLKFFGILSLVLGVISGILRIFNII